MMFSKFKTGAICFLGFAMTSAYAGSVEITSCEPGSLSYKYSVSEETGTIYINSASTEDISLEPISVANGSGQMEHDFSDLLPDTNNYVTLVDGTSISTALCQALTDEDVPTSQ